MPERNDVVFSLDWLSLTVWESKDEIVKWLKEFLDLGELEFSGHGGIGFAQLYFGRHGFQLYALPVAAKDDAVYCSLRFPGECLRAVGLQNLVRFALSLRECGVRTNCTRLDAAFDTQGFSVQDVVDARDVGLVECRASVFREIVEQQGDERTGHTVYFGARSSEAMLRIYYKTDGHSFGDEAFTRVEMELKGDRSSRHFVELLDLSFEDWGREMGGIIAAFIKVGRDWWESFVRGFYAFWLRISRRPETLDRMGKWLRQQVAPTLACYVMATTGGDVGDMYEYFRTLTTQGVRRFDKFKQRLARDGGADVADVMLFFDACAGF